MRKILMFGTMLGVATTALAFGGMFNHGSKSTTYKGGVSAIGVHFGGEKSTDSKDVPSEICAEGVLKDRFGHCNVCENGTVYLSYMDNPCGIETDVTGCVSNKDCDSDAYCVLNNSLTEGTCEPLSEGEIYVYNGQEFFGHWEFMNWWSAQNWCRAYGKEMISLADLGIDKTQLGEYYAENGVCNSAPYGTPRPCADGVVDWDGLEAVFGSNYWRLSDFHNNGTICMNTMPLKSSYHGISCLAPGNVGPAGAAMCKYLLPFNRFIFNAVRLVGIYA